MKFDRDWVLEHLTDPPDADTVAERLTACGLLVELREADADGEMWDVEVTTNRPDAMNHRGLAREVAVACGIELRPLEVALEETAEPTEDLAEVAIHAPEACTRFCARVVRGVEISSSPEWLQRRLERCGVRPINAVVDVTNYVMLTLGQPLHAYDRALVADHRLEVRPAHSGERLETLDGETRTLTAGMPVIADGTHAVGLAGLMGGAETEIGPATRDVLLEAAHFEPLPVRRTARALGMHTEASHRFERGADPELPPVAVDLAAAMIAELCGGSVCAGRIDVRPRPWSAPEVTVDGPGLAAFAGREIDPAEMIRILGGLGFSPEPDGELIHCRVPSWRVDVERSADLAEEVIRHVGYDSIPARLPVLSTVPGHRDPQWERVDRARNAAVAAGLAEVMTFAFVDPGHDEPVSRWPLNPGEPLSLANPLTTTQSVMRRSLLPGLLAATREVVNQGETEIAAFEQGRVFWADADGTPGETPRLAVILSGGGDGWLDQPLPDFERLKSVVETVRSGSGLPEADWQRGGDPWLDPAAAAVLTAGERVVGVAGAVSARFRGVFELRQPVFVAELDLSLSAPPARPRFGELPRFPAVVADMTVEHPVELAYGVLEETVRELASHLVETVALRVRYQGEGLPAGHVRTTVRLVYRHPERSLTQDEVNQAQDSLRSGVTERLQVGFA